MPCGDVSVSHRNEQNSLIEPDCPLERPIGIENEKFAPSIHFTLTFQRRKKTAEFQVQKMKLRKSAKSKKINNTNTPYETNEVRTFPNNSLVSFVHFMYLSVCVRKYTTTWGQTQEIVFPPFIFPLFRKETFGLNLNADIYFFRN